MVSFDMIPKHDAAIHQMARCYLSQTKGITKFKNALKKSNAYRIYRKPDRIVIEYLNELNSEDIEVKARYIYELMPPFS
jgi:hypothetical protein